jgi:hypothetical protein
VKSTNFLGNIYSLKLIFIFEEQFRCPVCIFLFGTVQEQIYSVGWTSRLQRITRIIHTSNEVTLIKTKESKIRYAGFLKLSLYVMGHGFFEKYNAAFHEIFPLCVCFFKVTYGLYWVMHLSSCGLIWPLQGSVAVHSARKGLYREFEDPDFNEG